ncbi:plasmid mobilization protein [Actinocorallia longicatena]|uniref:Mobilization protein MobC n=1 Tax=Actinocorallia longicatena TaxID=111803 RepID=A0ABP6QE22_9ACTN
MTDINQGRRRARRVGGRKHSYHVRLTDEENAIVCAKAEAAGVSVPWLLAETTLDPRQGVAERKALIDELLALRRLVGRIGTNINQLARIANGTGKVPAEAFAAITAANAATKRISEAAAEIRNVSRRRS